MNITVRYTQPQFFPNQAILTNDHVIACSDTETLPNGHPKPLDPKWETLVANIDNISFFEVI
jgi:hypothetical protein